MRNVQMTANAWDCAGPVDSAKLKKLQSAILNEVGKLKYAIRYLVRDWRGIKKDEVQLYHEAGIGLFLVYEQDPTHDSYFTVQRGYEDAADAAKNAEALNVPKNVGICYAVDEGTRDFQAVLSYFEAIRKANNGYPIGVYGDCDVITFLQKHGVCDFYFQTYAWSGNKIADNLAALQFHNEVNVGGVIVDLDYVYDGKYAWTKVIKEHEQTKAAHVVDRRPCQVTGDVWLHNAPNFDVSSEIRILRKGEEYWVYGEKNGMYDLGQHEYASKKYIKLISTDPKATPEPSTYTVEKGEYLSEIGHKLGISWRKIAELNGIKAPYNIYPGQILKLPGVHHASHLKNYVVENGDTMIDIGNKLGVDWHEIAKLNHINKPYTIYPGEKLKYQK